MPEEFKFWSLEKFAEKYLEVYSRSNTVTKEDLLMFSYEEQDAAYIMNHRDFSNLEKEDRELYKLYEQMFWAYHNGNTEAQKNFQLVGLFIQDPQNVGRGDSIEKRWPDAKRLILEQKISPKLAEAFLKTASKSGFPPYNASKEGLDLLRKLPKMMDDYGQWIPTKDSLRAKTQESNANLWDFYQYSQKLDFANPEDQKDIWNRVHPEMEKMLKAEIKGIRASDSNEKIAQIFNQQNFLINLFERQEKQYPEYESDIKNWIERIKTEFNLDDFMKKIEAKRNFIKKLENAHLSETFKDKPNDKLDMIAEMLKRRKGIQNQ